MQFYQCHNDLIVVMTIYPLKNLKYDGYQRGLALIVHSFFDKKTEYGTVKNDNM